MYICLANSNNDIHIVNWENVLSIDNIGKTFRVKIPETLRVIHKYRFPIYLPHDYFEFIKSPYNFNCKSNERYINLLNGKITISPLNEAMNYHGMLVPFFCYQGDHATCLFVANNTNIYPLNTPYANIYGIRDIGIHYQYAPILDEKMLDREIDNFLKMKI